MLSMIKNNAYRLAHVLSGVFTLLPYLIRGLSPIERGFISFFSFFGFFVYEIGQYWYKDDAPSREIIEFMIGFYAVLIWLFLTESLIVLPY